MDSVKKKTGLYKVQVENVRNPPSLRGSGNFGAVYQTTKIAI